MFVKIESIDVFYSSFTLYYHSKLDVEKDFIVFALDSDDIPMGHSYCKDIKNAGKAVAEAKLEAKKRNTVAICVGRHFSPSQELVFDDEIKEAIAIFKEAGKKLSLPLRDFVLLKHDEIISAETYGLV